MASLVSKSTFLLHALSISLALGNPIAMREVFPVAISQDFADPSVIENDGQWYAFATASAGKNVQVASSDSLQSGWSVLDKDAMPTLPSWVDSNNPGLWAPDVVKRDDGKFVLYFTANKLNSTPYGHCIGAAESNGTDPTGPYIAKTDTLACSNDQGGSIDPSGFQDSNGDRYVLYKIDGNGIGEGGICNNWQNGNPNQKIMPTPIMLQKLVADGLSTDGDPVQILDRDDFDGPLIEAPSLNLKDGIYYLFFSSNCYSTDFYDTSFATSTSIAGPYTKAHAPDAPLLKTGNFDLTAPGGADVTPDGNNLVFHATHQSNPLVRYMYVAAINEHDNVVDI